MLLDCHLTHEKRVSCARAADYAPAPGPAPPAPSPAPPVPRFNATSFVFLLNLGAASATVNIAAAMGRAGLGADGWASPLMLVVDTDAVKTRGAERLDSTAVTVQPWGALIMSLRLDANANVTA